MEAIQESNKKKDIYGGAILNRAKEAEVLKSTVWSTQFRLGRLLKSLGKNKEALALDPTQGGVRILRDELATPVNPRKNLLSTFAEERKNASKVTGIPITPSTAMKFAKTVSGFENPNFSGLEDLIKGHQYRDGDGVPKDPRKEFEHDKLSADKGNAEGMYYLALAYMRRDSVEKHFKRAFELLNMVLTAPNITPGTPCPTVSCAYYTLCWLHSNGMGVHRDLRKAYYYYEEASERGHASAAFQLGNMHSSGEVSRDPEKAVQYWKLAVKRGTPEGMIALAFHSLKQGDFKVSNDWYEKARLTRFVTPEIEEEYKELRQKMKLANESLKEIEGKKRAKGDSNTGENMWHRLKQVNAPLGDLLKLMMERADVQQHPLVISSELKYDSNIVRRFASKGHIYAQQMYKGQTHFFKSLELLPHAVSDSTGNFKAEFVREYAECIRTTAEFICTKSFEETVDMLKVVKEVLDKKGDDRDARLCWIDLNFTVPIEIKKFVEVSLKKYPEEPRFHHFMCSVHGFLQEFDLGAKRATDALKLFPDDVELLFDAGEHYRLANQNAEAAVFLKRFLEVAPKDHRKYPELCYNLALVILDYGASVSDATVIEARKYFLLGQESETLLMPFFPPCDELSKKMASGLLDKLESTVKKGGKKKKSAAKKDIREDGAATNLSKSRLSDPYRIQIIKVHRERALKQKSMEARGEIIVEFPPTAQTVKVQKAPKIFENCKSMYLQEMETFDDKIFVGRFVTVTVIDEPLEIDCLNLIVEDDKGTPLRASLCDPGLLKKRPMYGAKIRLYNPYYRLARDGEPTLRIEDPKSVVVESIDPSLCRSCCTPGAGFTCAKCKKAKYCNKECQANDWKNFRHKLICD